LKNSTPSHAQIYSFKIMKIRYINYYCIFSTLMDAHTFSASLQACKAWTSLYILLYFLFILEKRKLKPTITAEVQISSQPNTILSMACGSDGIHILFSTLSSNTHYYFHMIITIIGGCSREKREVIPCYGLREASL